MSEMLSRIERQATELAWTRHKEVVIEEMSEQEKAALAVRSLQTRKAAFADITPTQQFTAENQHRERFTPLQRMLDHVAPLLLDVRNRYFAYGAKGQPKVVEAHHYERPYTEGGPNLYHASLTLLDLHPDLDPDAPNKIAFMVYALADQFSPTQQSRFLGLTLREAVPRRVNYALCTRFMFIDGRSEPAAKDFLERCRVAKEDLEIITPAYDLYQPSPKGGVVFSSEPVKHLNAYEIGSYMAGARFDPDSDQFTNAEKFLEQRLAQLLASRVPLQPTELTTRPILVDGST